MKGTEPSGSSKSRELVRHYGNKVVRHYENKIFQNRFSVVIVNDERNNIC